MDYKITLEEFLGLIEDEEVRVELEIDFGEDGDEEYHYYHFWYSDYRVSDEVVKEYRKYKVTSFSLLTEVSSAEIKICVKNVV